MDFRDVINKYENYESNKDIIDINGVYKIMITAPHSINQYKSDNSFKKIEPYTKAIALYLADKLNINALVNNKNTGIDPNEDRKDEFKNKLIKTINDKDILLVLDIHGANKDHEFDIELGTLNNLSASTSTINELKEAFYENKIYNININNPFKGGAITQNVYGKTNAEIIQIEINRKYRNIESIENIKSICDSLESFIKQYIKVITK